MRHHNLENLTCAITVSSDLLPGSLFLFIPLKSTLLTQAFFKGSLLCACLSCY